MTKEERLDWLCRLRSEILYADFSIDTQVSLERRKQYKQALSEVIKTLEQEPFINKPCVSEKACEHDKNVVLGKIRAKIEKAIWYDVLVICDGTDELRIPRLDPDDVFEIIDKYTESEERSDKRTSNRMD